MNTSNPLHWTLNSCFSAFHSVREHLGSFRNCMKLGAKRGEVVQLMQKFVAQSHVGIFSQRTHPIRPLDPKLMFRSVWLYFGAFGIVS